MVRDSDSHLHECVPKENVCRVQRMFRELCDSMTELYSVEFPPFECPSSTCGCAYVKALKSFCGGLIEGDKSHKWRSIVHRLSSRQRLSVAASLFLFRKVLPTPSADLGSYMDKMSTPSPSPDPDFLLFCRSRIARLFRDGWDRNYTKLPKRVVLPRSSCVECGMSRGGQRALAASGDSWVNRQEFCQYVLESRDPRPLGPSRVVSVETGGKNRIVSTPTIDMNFLRPLHTAMYDHLSRNKWLLRGDATLKRFEEFHRVPGEVFVSGDYESATDNLNTEVQEFILREVLQHARHVPEGVKGMALASLRMRLRCGDREVNQCRGQLMGNLLSFPLLCLVNYLAFRFFCPGKIPVRINGDDIVFRASPEVSKRWMEGVGRSGLTLSRGKTMVNHRFFSLNSRFFEGHGGTAKRACSLVPVIRSKAFFGSVAEGVLSLRDRSRSFIEGMNSRQKKCMIRRFLVVNRRFIVASGRSVRNGLGLRVDQDDLEATGMWLREIQYLAPDKRTYIRETPLFHALKQADPYRVEGWSLQSRPLTKLVIRWQREHSELVSDLIWSKPVVRAPTDEKELKTRIRDTGRDYGEWMRSFRSLVHRVAKFCKISRNLAHRKCRPYVRLPDVCSDWKVGLVHVPDGASRRNVVFTSNGGSWEGNSFSFDSGAALVHKWRPEPSLDVDYPIVEEDFDPPPVYSLVDPVCRPFAIRPPACLSVGPYRCFGIGADWSEDE